MTDNPVYQFLDKPFVKAPKVIGGPPDDDPEGPTTLSINISKPAICSSYFPKCNYLTHYLPKIADNIAVWGRRAAEDGTDECTHIRARQSSRS